MAKILFFQPNQADHAAGLSVAAVGEESIAFQDGAMGAAINHVHAFAVQNHARQSVNVGKLFAAADVFKRIDSFRHRCAKRIKYILPHLKRIRADGRREIGHDF